MIIFGKKGFSLVEILVVVLIIGILSSIAVPQYTKYKEIAAQKTLVSYIDTIQQALETCMLLKENVSQCWHLENDMGVKDINRPKFATITIPTAPTGLPNARTATTDSSLFFSEV